MEHMRKNYLIRNIMTFIIIIIIVIFITKMIPFIRELSTIEGQIILKETIELATCDF